MDRIELDSTITLEEARHRISPDNPHYESPFERKIRRFVNEMCSMAHYVYDLYLNDAKPSDRIFYIGRDYLY